MPADKIKDGNSVPYFAYFYLGPKVPLRAFSSSEAVALIVHISG